MSCGSVCSLPAHSIQTKHPSVEICRLGIDHQYPTPLLSAADIQVLQKIRNKHKAYTSQPKISPQALPLKNQEHEFSFRQPYSKEVQYVATLRFLCPSLWLSGGIYLYSTENWIVAHHVN